MDVLFETSSSDSARQVITAAVDQAGVPFIVGPGADSDITERSPTRRSHGRAWTATTSTSSP